MESKQIGKVSPSRAPMLNKCAFFSGKKHTSSSAGRGTLIDDALRHVIENGLDTYEIREKYIDEFISPIVYGYNFVLNKMTYPVASKSECRVKSTDDRVSDGEVDCIDIESGIIIDFKSGQVRDYYFQMLFYAYLVLNSYEHLDAVTCYVCYLDKQFSDKYIFSRSRINRLVDDYFSGLEKQNEPTPCQYCSWCEHKHSCSKRCKISSEFMRVGSGLSKENILSDSKTLKRFLDGAPIYIDMYESIKSECIAKLKAGGSVDGYRLQTQSRKNGLVYILKKEKDVNKSS